MAAIVTPKVGQGMGFGLIFFSSSEAPFGDDKYRLVLESTRFADAHGFSSVWIPERHFTKDGWLYPNPAVLQAALARETQQIQLRAGSVVVPLHNPLRIAEEWAMVDNLSGGRVGISFASGWHPNDFALFPEHYQNRNEVMYQGIETVRKLWRGEAVQVPGGDGSLVELRTFPTPLQPELPFWITAAGNPKTFAKAGEIGAHLLTHMYNQSPAELGERIRIYRDARARAGYDPTTGIVSVMLHTFVGKDETTVRAQLDGPFCEYLKSASYLVNAIAYSRGQQVDLASLSEQDLQEYLRFVLDRLISTQRVLFGTPEQCFDLVRQLQAVGVNEIACQMDFGVDVNLVLESLPYLEQLKNLSETLLGNEQTTPTSADNALTAAQRRCSQAMDVHKFYEVLSTRGIQLAQSFQGIQELRRGTNQASDEALGRIQLPPSLEQDADAYQIHPALLDACLQVLIATLPDALTSDTALYLPVGIGSFQQHAPLENEVWSYARLTKKDPTSPDGLAGDVRILNSRGEVLAEARGIQLQSAAPATPVTPTVPTQELSDWLYELQWEAASFPSRPLPQGTWILFIDGQGAGERLAALLEARGARCIRVSAGARFRALSEQRYEVNPTLAEDVQYVIEDVQRRYPGPVAGIVHLWSLDATPTERTTARSLEADQVMGVGSALCVIQALTRNAGMESTRLWLVTRGAQPVDSQTDTTNLAIAQSPLWGLGKTCAMEHPELWGGMIDLDPANSDDLAQVLDVISAGTEAHEDLVAFRHGKGSVARMVHAQPLTPRPLKIRADGTYLITGGLWGLGLEVAHWLAHKGARHLILLGRSRLPARTSWDTVPAESRAARQIAGLRSLEALGIDVQYEIVDVAHEEQLSTFLRRFRAVGKPPLRGVMHAASVWQDEQGNSLVRPLAQLSSSGLHTVFRPKVLGSWLLYTSLKQEPLDFFVSFSSAASLFGSAAQANYAAAGEFMDVLAHLQRAHGQPALSVDWGAISEIGFGATPEGERVHQYWETHGIERINPRQVLSALELLIPQQVARMGVIKLNWRALQDFYPQLIALPLLKHLALPATTAPTHSDTPAQQSSLLTAFKQADTTGRLGLLEDYVAEQVAGVLHIPATRLDRSQPLTALGLDSLMAIELKNRMEHELTVRIPIVTFLQGPTIEQFSAQMREQLAETLALQTVPPGPQNAVATPAPQAAQRLTALQGADAQQEAARLLTELDGFTDQDVDTLLSQLLQEQDQGQLLDVEEHAANGLHAQDTGSEISAEEAAQLLARLEELSDEDVDSLLSQFAQKEDV